MSKITTTSHNTERRSLFSVFKNYWNQHDPVLIAMYVPLYSFTNRCYLTFPNLSQEFDFFFNRIPNSAANLSMPCT